jgi:phage major head subunit gpT-like protein
MFKVTTPAERAQMLREAEALRTTEGGFADDAARKEFDARMEAVEAYDKQAATPTPAPASAPNADEIRAAERARVTSIQDACRIAKVDDLAAGMVQRGITIDAARSEIFTALAARDAAKPETHQRIAVGEDASDKWARGVTNWLLVKSGMAGMVARSSNVEVSTIDPGEFRGLTLVDLARECLVRAGVAVRGLDKSALVAKALTLRASATQSTSDFTYALENTMHKVLQAAYAVTPDTWSKWCKRGTVSDFRAHYRYRMGSFGALDDLTENGEFKAKAITDAERASITASTVGNKVSVSRKMIINDDMGVFSSLLTGLGRAAALSVEVDAYALLAQNAGLGPTMADGLPVFNSLHLNIGVQAALSAAAIDADAALMARQTDKDGNDYLDLQPAVLLVERALRGTALSINDAQYDPDTANKLQKPNTVRGMFRDVVATPRFASAATRRYLFADPSIYPVFEVAFLEGNESPVLESKDGWDTDGAEMRVRFDYGVAALDYRGAVTNAG